MPTYPGHLVQQAFALMEHRWPQWVAWLSAPSHEHRLALEAALWSADLTTVPPLNPASALGRATWNPHRPVDAMAWALFWNRAAATLQPRVPAEVLDRLLGAKLPDPAQRLGPAAPVLLHMFGQACVSATLALSMRRTMVTHAEEMARARNPEAHPDPGPGPGTDQDPEPDTDAESSSESSFEVEMLPSGQHHE